MTDTDVPRSIEVGLAAWRRGDLDGLERVLHPDVTLKTLNPGPWDCHSRSDVMTLLRTRAAQHPDAQKPEVSIQQLDPSTYLATGLGGPKGTATVVTVADDLVVAMQQISTETRDRHADQAVAAIHAGDLAALTRALDASPGLAHGPIPGYQGRTLLHIVTDWPGFWPQAPAAVEILISRGADPNDRGEDPDGETPLHWAASSDDADVAAALIRGGADLEAPNGSIGTPLDNAIGYSCWNVARLLVASGSVVEKPWHAAALGDLARTESLLTAGATPDDINQAFWHACAAGHRRTAELLLQAGADLHWTPDYAEGTALDAASGRTTQQDNVITWLTDLGLQPTQTDSPT